MVPRAARQELVYKDLEGHGRALLVAKGTGGRKGLRRAGESVTATGVTARFCLQMPIFSIPELAAFLFRFTVAWRLWFSSLYLYTNFLRAQIPLLLAALS